VPDTASPLVGLKVLDLSRILAGPYCTQLLADLGAEVIKLEPPHGDDTRHWGPPFRAGESAYYLSVNRGKKSLAVNLKDPRGQRLAQALGSKADVLVENFKTGDLARYGLDYASLRPRNPRLIYASITGFGHSGPRAKEPGYDVALQGISGLMSITGEADGPPVKVGVAWIDILTGLHASVAILAALRERERSGEGQHLDLALFDTALASLANQAQRYLLTGEVPQRLGSAHPQIVPYQAFEAQDGYLILAAGNDAQFRRACEVLGLDELAGEARFASNAGRVEHRDEVVSALAARFITQPRAVWLERLTAAQVPVTPVNDVAEAFADPQVEARGMLWELPHPLLGTLTMPASPLKALSRTPLKPTSAPPLLGEHSEEILREVLELPPEEIDGLIQAGVVKTPRR
jgi:crotonobetainyl-CoA:carnitine CoA-transferase CaiB-like acyl-CoA transferase